MLAIALAMLLAATPLDCLFIRHAADGKPYGAEELDPLLWAQTRFLLTGQSRAKAISCLDAFLKSPPPHDPLERAMLQHKLWALFDWLAMPHPHVTESTQPLMDRVARAMRHVALTSEQIRALPETPLPENFLEAAGPWVCLSGNGDKPIAMMHFTGRSRFLIFMRPPAGGAVALVRQMMLIDTRGNIVPTHVTEDVAIRVDGRFREYRLSGGALREVAPDEKEFHVFFSGGVDPFETPDSPLAQPASPIQTCSECHSGSGLRAAPSAAVLPLERAIAVETQRTIAFKREQPAFTMLSRYFRP